MSLTVTQAQAVFDLVHWLARTQGAQGRLVDDHEARQALRVLALAELEQLVADGMAEAARVLRPKGRLLVKCMDYVNGSQYVTGRHHVVTTALDLGLRQVDEFVHHSGVGPQPARDVQYHSRRAHSFLCVFRKPAR